MDIKHYCAYILSSYLLLRIDINETTYEFEWYKKESQTDLGGDGDIYCL